jgi:hypothetical protein
MKLIFTIFSLKRVGFIFIDWPKALLWRTSFDIVTRRWLHEHGQYFTIAERLPVRGSVHAASAYACYYQSINRSQRSPEPDDPGSNSSHCLSFAEHPGGWLACLSHIRRTNARLRTPWFHSPYTRCYAVPQLSA